MSVSSLKELYLFELDNLTKEINAYTNEENIWVKKNGINNSAGNLCLHVVGNINHFLGATIIKNGYLRNRDEEFSLNGVPKAQLLASIEALKPMVKEVFDSLQEADLDKIYPIDFMGSNTTDFYLTRFLAHLSYHVGQISYHRRILDNF